MNCVLTPPRRAALWRTLTAALVMTAAIVVPPSAVAQTSASAPPAPGVDAALDARVSAVSSRLRCPVCQGESIQDSPAELATQMKTLVREQLHAGRSEREVMDYFVEKYGQWILLEPRAEGINLLVYGLPIVFLAIGGGVLVLLVKRWTRPVDGASLVTPDGAVGGDGRTRSPGPRAEDDF